MIEKAVSFGPGGVLTGITTEPGVGLAVPDAPAVLFWNVGINHHVGPYRVNVDLRSKPRRGRNHLAALRRLGMGDSDVRPGAAALDLDRAIDDVRDAMALLEKRKGIRRFVLVGFCSRHRCRARLAVQSARRRRVFPRGVHVPHARFLQALPAPIPRARALAPRHRQGSATPAPARARAIPPAKGPRKAKRRPQPASRSTRAPIPGQSSSAPTMRRWQRAASGCYLRSRGATATSITRGSSTKCSERGCAARRTGSSSSTTRMRTTRSPARLHRERVVARVPRVTCPRALLGVMTALAAVSRFRADELIANAPRPRYPWCQ